MNRCLPCILFALFFVWGCKRRIDEPAPMQSGSYLKYLVTEQSPGSSIKTEVTLKFTQSGDTLQMNAQGESAATSAKLDLEGRPLEGQSLEIPIASGKLDLLQLWMPTKDRKNGTILKAGRVVKKRQYQNWQVWEVASRNKNSGALYYDDGMGILVGWQLQSGPLDIVGQLIDSQ